MCLKTGDIGLGRSPDEIGRALYEQEVSIGVLNESRDLLGHALGLPGSHGVRPGLAFYDGAVAVRRDDGEVTLGQSLVDDVESELLIDQGDGKPFILMNINNGVELIVAVGAGTYMSASVHVQLNWSAR